MKQAPLRAVVTGVVAANRKVFFYRWTKRGKLRPPNDTREMSRAWTLEDPHLVYERVDSIFAAARPLTSCPNAGAFFSMNRTNKGATCSVLGTVDGSATRGQTCSGRSTRLSR